MRPSILFQNNWTSLFLLKHDAKIAHRTIRLFDGQIVEE